jgi:AraC family transcriptional regulator of adaptative response/methylated-DNA-[protein]-cysteine methyltransferase
MILTSQIETPIGAMVAGAVEDGICLLEFIDRRMLNTEYKDLARLLKTEFADGENKHITEIRKQLKEYFEGIRKEFTVPVIAPGSEFQKRVWNELQKISFGSTLSYKELAEILNKPDSVRAVANANGLNRISIVIPCHRVIGSDGNLTGYGGGLTRKRWLLDHEKRYSGKAYEPELFSK